MNRIERLGELDKKATAGGWWVRFEILDYIVSGPEGSLNEVAFLDKSEDAELIALMRNTLPDLLTLYETTKQFHLSRKLIEDQKEVDWDAFEALGEILDRLQQPVEETEWAK